tara:strand:- start:277 stop:387 length:111 start_codon:yes stop_codon:yes gene_type:complete
MHNPLIATVFFVENARRQDLRKKPILFYIYRENIAI